MLKILEVERIRFDDLEYKESHARKEDLILVGLGVVI